MRARSIARPTPSSAIEQSGPSATSLGVVRLACGLQVSQYWGVSAPLVFSAVSLYLARARVDNAEPIHIGRTRSSHVLSRERPDTNAPPSLATPKSEAVVSERCRIADIIGGSIFLWAEGALVSRLAARATAAVLSSDL